MIRRRNSTPWNLERTLCSAYQGCTALYGQSLAPGITERVYGIHSHTSRMAPIAPADGSLSYRPAAHSSSIHPHWSASFTGVRTLFSAFGAAPHTDGNCWSVCGCMERHDGRLRSYTECPAPRGSESTSRLCRDHARNFLRAHCDLCRDRHYAPFVLEDIHARCHKRSAGCISRALYC